MEKLQLLFPSPVLSRLRALAKKEDRPVSEVVRRAVDRYLAQVPIQPTNNKKKEFPTFDGGKMIAKAKNLRELAYQDDES